MVVSWISIWWIFLPFLTLTQNNVIFIAQENVAETAEVASPPQPEVTDAQPVNADAENPPSGDAVTEASPSQPVDEVSPEGGVAEAASVVAEGDGTGQIQGEGEGGEGEKPNVEDEAKPAQEGQDNFEVSCFCCSSFPVFSKGQSNDLKLNLFWSNLYKMDTKGTNTYTVKCLPYRVKESQNNRSRLAMGQLWFLKRDSTNKILQ